MGTVRRFKDIVNSNLSAVLDKAEDPEKMIKMMIHEMEDSLVELKRSCSEKIAEKVVLKKEVEILTQKIDQWQNRAEMAVAKGKDDLAKEAIQAKQKYEQEKSFREKDVEHIGRILEETKDQIATVEAKLEEVQQKYRLLIQRGIHAVEKKQVRKVMKEASGASAMARFDQLENRIERMEAEAELTGRAPVGSFDGEFSAMEDEAKIDDELAALKSRMATTKPESKAKSAPKKSEATEVKEA